MREQLERLRIYFLRKQPFFYFLLSNVQLTYSQRQESPIEVSDYSLSFSPSYISLPSDLKIDLLRYALISMIQNYPQRARIYDGNPKSFRIASVMRITLDIGDDFRKELVFRALHRLANYSKQSAVNLSAEEIARLLDSRGKAEPVSKEVHEFLPEAGLQKLMQSFAFSNSSSGALSGKTQGRPDDSSPDSNQDGEVLQQLSDDLRRLVSKGDLREAIRQLAAKAAVFSRVAGRSDPLTERLVGDILTVRVPWVSLIRNFLSEGLGSKVLQSYSRMNRRYPDLPGITRWRKDIVVAVDVSGSIDDDLFAKFLGVLDALRGVSNVTFVAWDTQAQEIGRPRSLQDIKLMASHVKGYGGTQPNCLVPLLKKLRPRLTVILTDGRWGAWNDLARWSRGRRVIVATTDYVDPAWRFWRIIGVGKE
ncbi:MAG: VWA-like domain-containing protein [Candidatus Caldarchaeum sp.]